MNKIYIKKALYLCAVKINQSSIVLFLCRTKNVIYTIETSMHYIFFWNGNRLFSVRFASFIKLHTHTEDKCSHVEFANYLVVLFYERPNIKKQSKKKNIVFTINSENVGKIDGNRNRNEQEPNKQTKIHTFCRYI